MTIFSLVIIIITLYDVSSTSPGYLPVGNITQEEYLQKQEVRLVKEFEIELKYCDTCFIIRDLRSFHCRICGYCVEKHDHHCPWVGNCIGKNNIKKFLFFLIATFTHSSLIFATSLYFILINHERMNKEDKTYVFIISIIICAFSGIILILMLFSVINQVCLISRNLTTNECLRSKLPSDLYDKGCSENCKEVFFL